MKTTSFNKVRQIITEHFPELSVREGWSTSDSPRVLLLDTIHLEDKPDYLRVQTQIASLVTALPGVSVGWQGAEVAVRIMRAQRKAVSA